MIDFQLLMYRTVIGPIWVWIVDQQNLFITLLKCLEYTLERDNILWKLTLKRDKTCQKSYAWGLSIGIVQYIGSVPPPSRNIASQYQLLGAQV